MKHPLDNGDRFDPLRSVAYVKIFITTLCVVLAFFVAAISILLLRRSDDEMQVRLRDQAILYRDLIRPNHAVMINEMSRSREQKEKGVFRVTTLRPLNPENAPDTFETEALVKFQQQRVELFRLESPPGRPPVFRYLAPLVADRSCLECHRFRGYKVGSCVGAVSISFPAEEILRGARAGKLQLIIAVLLALVLLGGIISFLGKRLIRKVAVLQRRTAALISTDELTRIRNRRYVLRRLEEECERADRLGTSLSILLIDLDHFKRVNDSFGHPFGDQVLRQSAARMKETLRRYDVLGRIGGEEFLILSPGATLENAMILAERVRRQLEDLRILDGDRESSVTVSIGVTSFGAEARSPDILMRRADALLYQAKEQGRNRVVGG